MVFPRSSSGESCIETFSRKIDGSIVTEASCRCSSLPAGNFATNALYVNALLGLTPAEVALNLDSLINIYYNPAASPALLAQTFALNSGGSLIPLFSVSEPSTAVLLMLGIALLGRRSRRR